MCDRVQFANLVAGSYQINLFEAAGNHRPVSYLDSVKI